MIHVQQQRHRMLKVSLAFFSIMVGALIARYALYTSESSEISCFSESRDLVQMVKLFEDNWYWMTTRDYEPGYAEFIFKTQSPNDYDARYVGKLQIQVARHENDLVGFVAYYMHTGGDGQVLFLALNPAYRGKGYGEKLLNAAFTDLKKRGANRMWLLTRIDNQRAQTLYRRFGLVETRRDEGFVYFDWKK